jgi:hypothetical protein
MGGKKLGIGTAESDLFLECLFKLFIEFGSGSRLLSFSSEYETGIIY